MSTFRSWLPSLLRGFRFGCGGLLAGWLVAGCAGRTPQSFSNLFRKGRMRVVSGYVLDSVSRQPMACVPVAKNGAQVLTNAAGYFRLQYPVEKKRPIAIQDKELRFFSLDYQGRVALPVDSSQLVTLLLKRIGYRSRPSISLCPTHSTDTSFHWVTVRPRSAEQMSPFTRFQLGFPNMQQAFLIRDSTSQLPRKLRTVTFQIGADRFARELFTVRLYQFDGPNEPPGQELARLGDIFPSTTGAFTYDFSRNDIRVPGNGFFLTIEYSVGSDYFSAENPVVDYFPMGPILRPPSSFADTRTWIGEIGKRWQRLPANESSWPRYESSVGVEVEPAR